MLDQERLHDMLRFGGGIIVSVFLLIEIRLLGCFIYEENWMARTFWTVHMGFPYWVVQGKDKRTSGIRYCIGGAAIGFLGTASGGKQWLPLISLALQGHRWDLPRTLQKRVDPTKKN